MLPADTGSDLSMDVARSRSVMIGTPAHHNVEIVYTASLVGTAVLLERLGIPQEVRFLCGNSNLPKARNEIVAEFLASDKSHLLMVDSDMGWEPDSVVRLLASPHRVIGAVGRKKYSAPNSDPNVWCAVFPKGPLVQDDHGAVEVERIGTGFLMVSREALKLMIAAHPEWKRTAPDRMPERAKPFYHRVFAFADEVSEDFAFCDSWREIGGKVWVDPDIELSHVGEYDYRGRVSEIFR